MVERRQQLAAVDGCFSSTLDTDITVRPLAASGKTRDVAYSRDDVRANQTIQTAKYAPNDIPRVSHA